MRCPARRAHTPRSGPRYATTRCIGSVKRVPPWPRGGSRAGPAGLPREPCRETRYKHRVPLEANTVVADRYVIVRPLGQGSMKQVYLATDRLGGGPVALALIVSGGRNDVTLGARFSREGKASAVLRSPHTVRVYEVGKLPDGTRYMATEAVLGRGLDQAMSQGPLEPQLAARFAVHVLAALEEAHRRGILHRDVKPENVLLAPTPQGEIAKLADFGLAKVLDVSLEGSQQLQTAQNIVLGTPEYMSPEQWQGSTQDGRTDLYALGVMLYEMLAGHPPFESEYLHALCIAHCTQPPPPLPAGLPVMAYRLEPIVRRAMQKHPVDRFADAGSMRKAIEQIAGVHAEGDTGAESSSPSYPGIASRAELLSDAWQGTLSLVAAHHLVLGRDPSTHVVVRCLPASDDNAMRTRSISREHARIAWREGRAWLTDLQSRSGTSVGTRTLTGTEAVPLASGDVISLGRNVRLRFDHPPVGPDGLPDWARLTRTDPHGGGQVHLQVIHQAALGAGADAALTIPLELTRGESVQILVHEGALAARINGRPTRLRDGDNLRIGTAVINVAVE